MVIVDLMDTYICVENLTNEKEHNGCNRAAYVDGDSGIEVEPLRSGEYKDDKSNNGE